MSIPKVSIPKVSRHGGELLVLAFVAAIVGLLAWSSVKHGDAVGAAAWSAALMAIINGINNRQSNRTIDAMQSGLQQSAPIPAAAAPGTTTTTTTAATTTTGDEQQEPAP